MDLRARLKALELASGKLPTPTAITTADSATRPPAARKLAPPALPEGAPSAAETRLARRLGGMVQAPGLVYREILLSPDHRHGGQELEAVQHIGSEPLGVAIPAVDKGWLFLDTETTGLAGGTGTLVFLFGGVQLDADGFRLRQWLLTRFGGEVALLDAVQSALQEVGMIVSFNGKSFDLPLLRTRQRMHARVLEEGHLVHLDLLHPARSAFAARWPDVRLQTAEQRLCAYQRDDDLPGAEAPLAFMRWMRSGATDALVRVMQHHRDDVLSLVTLCTALSATYRDPGRSGADEAGIVRRLNRRGYRVREGQAQLAFSPVA